MRRLFVLLFLTLPAAGSVILDPIATGLDRPVQVVASSSSLFIAEQTGLVLRLENGVPVPFLDLSQYVKCCSNGEGFLSIVFDPQYAANHRLYALFVDLNGNTELARVIDTQPVFVEGLLVAEQPKDNIPNHHGGTLLFGPDGMLYVSIGDGGANVQVTMRAQQLTHLLGKLLRIDVSGPFGYAIPPDNPFRGVFGDREEIWSFGLRNPWRYSFDRATGELYLADVGQDTWEEVNMLTLAGAKGANFGWPILEGTHCFPPGAACSASGYVLPKLEYSHALGCSITGGYRYRGSQHPEWNGLYFYGDLCSGRLWIASQRADGSWSAIEPQDTGKMIVSFGEDDRGELYLVDYKGAVYRMSPGTPPRRRVAAH